MVFIRRRALSNAVPSDYIKPTLKRRNSVCASLSLLSEILSFVYSTFIVSFGTFVFFAELPNFRLSQYSSWFGSELSKKEEFIFFVSSVYFGVDYFGMLLLSSLKKKVGYNKGVYILFHHLLNLLSILVSLVTKRDGKIVLGFLVLSHVHNSPMIISKLLSTPFVIKNLCVFPCLKDHKSRNEIIKLLEMLYLGLFALSRFAVVHYTAHVVVPFSELITSKLCVFGGIFLSFTTVWKLLAEGGKLNCALV